MREIKFRAWDKTKNKMVQVVTFLQSTDIDGEQAISTHGTCYTDYFSLEKEWDERWLHHNEFIIMQYTGLKDKNGKEIYEGDIINYLGYASNGEKCKKCGHKESGNTKMRVWIEDGHTRHTADSCDSGYANLTIEDSGHIEIIGNIYENPELLTPPKEIS